MLANKSVLKYFPTKVTILIKFSFCTIERIDAACI